MLGILCQICQQRPATSHLTEVEPDRSGYRELHICGACIRQLSLDLHTDPPSVEDVLAMRDGDDEGSPALGAAIDLTKAAKGATQQQGSVEQEVRRRRCPQCGLTFAEFAQSNRFGCPGCYDAFGAELEHALGEIHGSPAHVGRVPHGAADHGERVINERIHLQKALEQAIADEAYETAAELRDRQRALEEEQRDRPEEP